MSMEAIQTNAARFGRPMYRDRRGHEGGGQLYIARRERDFTRGLLSEMGHSNDYLVFQPSGFFVRVLGDGVLRLNAALSDFRSQALDHVLSLEGDALQAHYAELNARIEDTRDRLFDLTEYCNKGFDGQFREALASIGVAAEEPEGGTEPDGGAKPFAPSSAAPAAPESEMVEPAAASEAAAVVPAAAPGVFERLRRRNLEQGILTDFGREQGCVAFQPCPFYGRFMSEIAYTLNDALRRMEGQTAYYIVDGNGEELRRYCLELKNSMAALRGDLDGIIAFCRRKAA